MASLTSIERDDPPVRRKSCDACKKSRRRCDQARPTCQRCLRRNIECRYPHASQAPTRRRPEAVDEIVSGPQRLTSFDNVGTPYTPSCLGMLDSILEPTDDSIYQLFHESLDCNTPSPHPTWSNPRLLTTAQDALNRSQLVAVPQVGRAITSRLQYAMDKILAAPSQMVLENQTPWCHAHLYDDDAVSSAALHAAMNHVNARVIRENIEGRVQDLLSSPLPTTPLDVLAYAQALLIYQVLRLLDNDARVRSTYEATIPHLEEAAYALIPYIEFDKAPPTNNEGPTLDLIPLYPASAAHSFWASWVFQESAKRTLGMINFFVLTYHYMKGESGNRCSQNKTVAVNRSVTMSAHLWKARDPVDFALAWRNKRHFVINVGAPDQLATVIEEAKTDDIDDFGKICLTAVMGLTEAKGWLAMRGITL
ncbi:hypothetical protein FDECE_2304 [Fusarium decemcellulare]|nr:hypothetical protein FDECE_2304 [Fusarium decemcellulare]